MASKFAPATASLILFTIHKSFHDELDGANESELFAILSDIVVAVIIVMHFKILCRLLNRKLVRVQKTEIQFIGKLERFKVSNLLRK